MDVPTPNLVESAKQSNEGVTENTETRISADGTKIITTDIIAPRNGTAKMAPQLPEPPALLLTTRPGNEGFAPTVDPSSSSQTAEVGTTTDGPVSGETGVYVDNINTGTTGIEDARQTTNPRYGRKAVVGEGPDVAEPPSVAAEDARCKN